MNVHLGSLALGGVLVAGGFLLGSQPAPMRAAEAGTSVNPNNGEIVTSDDAVPGRIYCWSMMGSLLRSVTVHDCDRVGGTVTSRVITPSQMHGGR
jgi:hypothetical protein